MRGLVSGQPRKGARITPTTPILADALIAQIGWLRMADTLNLAELQVLVERGEEGAFVHFTTPTARALVAAAQQAESLRAELAVERADGADWRNGVVSQIAKTKALEAEVTRLRAALDSIAWQTCACLSLGTCSCAPLLRIHARAALHEPTP